MPEAGVARFAEIDLFATLDAAALEAWERATVVREVVPGEVLAEHGRPPPGLLLLLRGSIETLDVDGTGTQGVDRYEAPSWMAAVALLTRTDMPVRVKTLTPSLVGVVAAEEFHRLVHAHPVVFDRIMRRVAPIYVRMATVEATRARLVSMTRLAAGLAHELNNPAAAVARAAADLGQVIDVADELTGVLVEDAVSRDDARRVAELHAGLLRRAGAQPAVGALDLADREDVLLAQLERHEVPLAWSLAEPLAQAGADAAWIERVADAAGPSTPRVVRAVAASLAARRLTTELREASAQIVSVVDAAKSYAYLDRDPTARIDIHEGLEATLRLMGRRLDGITVVRDYDRSAPMVAADAAALNQVWAILLDNAADAAGDGGRITVATHRRVGSVLVTVTDDGPGIAPEIQGLVFDPFFTTKDVGTGRGLGLTTAHRIVVGGHGGAISVASQAGRTEMTVRLSVPEPRSPRG